MKKTNEIVRRWRDFFLIFALAFFARLLFFFIARSFYADAWAPEKIGINHWLDIAQNLAAGRGFSHSAFLTYFPMGGGIEPTAARSPIPVFALSAILLIFKANSSPAFFVVSWLFSSLTAALLYLLAGKIFSSRKIALGAAIFYCFYLPEMYISTGYAAASESLSTFLLMGYFCLVLKQIETGSLKFAFFSGVALALAFLSKPIVLFFPFLYMGWAFWKARWKALAAIMVYLAAFIICVSPWVIRNQKVMGKPILTTTLSGYNLLRHNWLIARGEYRLCTAEDFLPIVRETIREKRKGNEPLTEVRLDEMFSQKAKEIIRQYPWRYLKFCVIRAGWLWYKIGGEKQPYLFWNLVIYAFMFPGLLFVILRKRSDEESAFNVLKFLAFHILYFIFIHIPINAQFRFICPMMPYGILIVFYFIRFSCHSRMP